ncbi:MAG TPA: ATP-binding protein [Chloroflexia bacterium]|nr:ATP-binding protein [Chloroflexia bacterium]
MRDFISDALREAPAAIHYKVSQRMADYFPGKAVVETATWQFSLEEYAKAGLCSLTPKTPLHTQFLSYWDGEETRIYQNALQAWFTVVWQGYNLEVFKLTVDEDSHYWILADIREIAESFFRAVCEWELEIRSEVLVFDGDCWHKDEDLFKAIKSSTFDNLVLHGSLARDILADLQHFFESRDFYQTYGIPWKRGVLLVGPPGNGKTHAVKALINSLGRPCLYVKSFKGRRDTNEHAIQAVFERARKSAPCLLVLEDLDAQITPQNRSFFLNELDGFEPNTGILTLATTNYPEKLDPAIVNRPSRFDRKYHFDLPGAPEREDYIRMWNHSLRLALRLTPEGIGQIAAITEGFSFAYLKELFVSALMSWINQAKALQVEGSMDAVMAGQVSLLREQMLTTNTTPASEPESDPENK